LAVQLNGKIMNNIFNQLINLTKENKKKIIYLFSLLILILILSQVYIFYNKNKILKQSIQFYNSKQIASKDDFYNEMTAIQSDKGFYSLLASMEIINENYTNDNYDSVYNQYIDLITSKDLDNLYKTLIAINASYDLLNLIDSSKIYNLLSYVDDTIESFIGYKKEILFLLSILDNLDEEKEIIYSEITNNEKIPPSIKLRVKKIYEFEKYN
tara:strand:+ start:9023 stop:9658 length:636 start_codon:yes stop_codon:yes gene_type:complete